MTDAERQLLILIADLMLAIQPPGYVSLKQIERLREQVNRVRGTLDPVVIEVEDQSD